MLLPVDGPFEPLCELAQLPDRSRGLLAEPSVVATQTTYLDITENYSYNILTTISYTHKYTLYKFIVMAIILPNVQ